MHIKRLMRVIIKKDFALRELLKMERKELSFRRVGWGLCRHAPARDSMAVEVRTDPLLLTL